MRPSPLSNASHVIVTIPKSNAYPSHLVFEYLRKLHSLCQQDLFHLPRLIDSVRTALTSNR